MPERETEAGAPTAGAALESSLTRLRALSRRRTLRVRAFVAVVLALVLPQAFVFLWSVMERDIGGKMQRNAEEAASEAEGAVESSRENALDGPSTEAWLLDIAARHGLRIRLVSGGGKEILDCDRDQGTDIVHQVGTLFFGPDGAPSLREFDATLGALPSRAEVLEAEAHPERAESGCRSSPGAKLLVCHAVRVLPSAPDGTHEVIYVQESSRRAVRALYDLRYQLARLSLLTLPFALGLAWWMGSRMVGPLERLRASVLTVAGAARPAPALDVTVADDEIGDLAAAFNVLLASLEARRGENERFVADLVHEFKNPVAAIRASAEALASGAIDEERSARLARVLADSSGRLDGLVSQFLELARVEAGMPTEKRAPLDLAELARGIVEALSARHERVRFEVVANEEARVVGVAHRLDSALRNVIENATAFAEGASDSPAVRVVVSRAAEGVRVSVSDNGPGIAEEDLPRVFDRFFTTRDRERGSGLGLSLARAVVEAHGGSIVAESSPGRGATLRLTLPHAPAV